MAEHVCTQGDKFDRIETKLDTLIELQIENARIEEQMTSVLKLTADHEIRLRKVEQLTGTNSIFTKSFVKVVLVALSAIGTAVGGGLLGYLMGG